MSKRNRKTYKGQKTFLLFDADFPISIVENFREIRKWRRNFKFDHVSHLKRENKSDTEHFQYCNKNECALITMDNDFLDNALFPIKNSYGIVRISATKKNMKYIEICLENILSLLNYILLPKFFLRECKIQVNGNDFIIQKIDQKEGVLKKVEIGLESSYQEICEIIEKSFNYPALTDKYDISYK